MRACCTLGHVEVASPRSWGSAQLSGLPGRLELGREQCCQGCVSRLGGMQESWGQEENDSWPGFPSREG